MMASQSLRQMSDQQLTSLFFAGAHLAALSTRAKAIVAELETRGLIFDLSYGGFITCGKWNERHGRYLPMDCERQQREMDRMSGGK